VWDKVVGAIMTMHYVKMEAILLTMYKWPESSLMLSRWRIFLLNDVMPTYWGGVVCAEHPGGTAEKFRIISENLD
jgi:hypothetical protein